MDSETGPLVAAIIGGGVLMATALGAVAIRAGRLIEQVSRMERESRDRWYLWQRMWHDRCGQVDKRIDRLEQRMGRGGSMMIDDAIDGDSC